MAELEGGLVREKGPERSNLPSSWQAAARDVARWLDGAKLTVISPCCGLDTPLQALRACNCVDVRSICFDVEEKLYDALVAVHGSDKDVHVGPEKGDITKVVVSDLPNADLVIGGPPCTPYSDNGLELGWSDERSLPFASTLLVIKDQALRPDSRLMAFVLENVKGMTRYKHGEDQCPADEVMAWLRSTLLGWEVWLWHMEASTYGVNQHRPRIYICGRKIAMFEVPRPKIQADRLHIQRKMLRDILDEDAPPIDESTLTEVQAESLKHCREQVDLYQYESPHFVVAVFDLSRRPGKVRKPACRMDDNVMTLTTKNHDIWVEGVCKDLPSYKRFLLPTERAVLQGLDPHVCNMIPGRVMQRTAVGNAMCMPCVGLAIACTLQDAVERRSPPA